jgi:glycerol-3-phosphate acyltransferase PlsY
VTGGEIAGAVALGIGGYVAGSIPFGLVVGKRLYGVDVREHGSGNVGTTNVIRVLGHRAGILVLFGDTLKGLVPALLAAHLYAPWLAVTVAMLPVIGHMYSVFLRGSGGKGVAAGAAVVLALMWKVFLVILVVWLVVLFVSRYVSLASISATVGFPIMALLFREPLAYQVVSGLVAVIVIWAHRSNIRRIVRHCESRITFPWNTDGIVAGRRPHGH